eukprot:6189011-Pleurochrysis_carterae.AAC.4
MDSVATGTVLTLAADQTHVIGSRRIFHISFRQRISLKIPIGGPYQNIQWLPYPNLNRLSPFKVIAQNAIGGIAIFKIVMNIAIVTAKYLLLLIARHKICETVATRHCFPLAYAPFPILYWSRMRTYRALGDPLPKPLITTLAHCCLRLTFLRQEPPRRRGQPSRPRTLP